MDAEEKIQHWIDGLEQFDLWQSVCDFYKENEAQLVEMNREQLSRFETPEGQPLDVMFGGFGKVYNLYNTGAFYAGIHIETDDEQILFTSSDPKWQNEVPPQPGWFVSMTPLVEWFGMVLGVPEAQSEMVSTATSDYVSDTFRKIFD